MHDKLTLSPRADTDAPRAWVLRALTLLLLALGWLHAVAAPVRVQAVEVELVSRQAAVVPGQTLVLGLRIAHRRQWHTYWRNPGDSGLPTQIALRLPQGFQAGDIVWPTPRRIAVGPLMNFGYEDEIVLPVPVRVPRTIAARRLDFSAKADWLMCKDVCIPGEASVELSLPVRPDGPAGKTDFTGLFDSMLPRTPRERIDAAARIIDSSLQITYEDRGSGEVAFFPYAPNLIDNPAPQTLLRFRQDGKRYARLSVPLSDQFPVQDRTDPASPAAGALFAEVAGDLTIGTSAPVQLHLIRGEALVPAQPRVVDPYAFDPQVVTPQVVTPQVVTPQVVTPQAGDPSSATVATSIRDAGATSPPPALADSGGFGLGALLLAALGGLILNLMPCVFPVIGLKVLAFADRSEASRLRQRVNALWFGFGVLLSFWMLAALLLALRAAGHSVGWGFQLQAPAFVAAMALLFVLIGLNLSGVYQVGGAMSRLGNLQPRGHGAGAALMSGVLAVLVATPCSAPFMGTALGLTLSLSPAQALLVFSAIGLGMALPFLLLGWFPGWLRWLPRPGRWMESLRQLLAFPMYLSAAWLDWVLAQQRGIDAAFSLTLCAIVLALTAWIYGRFVAPATRARWVGWLAVACALGIALALLRPSLRDEATPAAVAAGATADSIAKASGDAPAPAQPGSDGWRAWSPAAVQAARDQGHVVFVDFTAAWCVSCQVNKKLVLERSTVIDEMRRAGVVRLRGDWTRQDPAITAELARHRRNGVPLYLVYRPGEARPRILSELLTTAEVISAIGPGTSL